jgi:hypothetical protein
MKVLSVFAIRPEARAVLARSRPHMARLGSRRLGGEIASHMHSSEVLGLPGTETRSTGW